MDCVQHIVAQNRSLYEPLSADLTGLKTVVLVPSKTGLPAVKKVTSYDEFMRELTAYVVMAQRPMANVCSLAGYDLRSMELYIELAVNETPDLLLFVKKRLGTGQVLVLKDGVNGLLLDASYGLEHMHKLGIVHGDVKPENIGIFDSPRGTVAKLMDFGKSDVRGIYHPGSQTYVPPEILAEGADPSSLEIMYLHQDVAWLAVSCVLHEVRGNAAHITTADGVSAWVDRNKLTTRNRLNGFKADAWALGVTIYSVVCSHAPWQIAGSADLWWNKAQVVGVTEFITSRIAQLCPRASGMTWQKTDSDDCTEGYDECLRSVLETFNGRSFIELSQTTSTDLTRLAAQKILTKSGCYVCVKDINVKEVEPMQSICTLLIQPDVAARAHVKAILSTLELLVFSDAVDNSCKLKCMLPVTNGKTNV